MTNPYQAPSTTSEAPISPRIPLWRRLVGLLCMLASGPISLYGLIINAMILWLAPPTGPSPVPLWIVMVAGGLIFTFGVGLGGLGAGLWTGHSSRARRGAVAIGVSIVAYIAVVLTFA